MRLWHTRHAAILLFPLFAACSCDETPLINVEPDAGIELPLPHPDAAMDASLPDATDAGFPDAAEPEARVLRFDGTTPVALYYGQQLDLGFFLRTASGVAVPSESLRFSFSGAGGVLAAATASTDGNGRGVVRFTAGSANAQGFLKVEADRAPALTIELDVHEDPAAALEVEVHSGARIHVGAAEAGIYIGPAGSVPTCAQLLAAAPAPTLAASFTQVPGAQSFSNLSSGSMVTVLATGTSTHGVLVARGCAEGTRLAGGSTTRVSVVLQQLPTDLSGNYDVLLSLDLGSTLPPPYDSAVGTVTDVLSDPAGWAVYQVLAAMDDQSGTVFVTWTPAGTSTPRIATFEEVAANPNIFGAWRRARAALDGFLSTQLGQSYLDITHVGADIAHVIRRFEVGAHYTITSSGTPGRYTVDESWRALVFEWQLGCPNGDAGCARRAVAMSGAHANLAPATAHFSATSTRAPLAAPGETERFHLALDPHAFDLRYGALVLLVLDEIVFPSLPNGLAGHSLSEVLINLVGCADVAASLGSSTGLPPVLFETLCDSAVSGAATALEARLLAIDSSSTPGISPTGSGELYLLDRDHDLQTELVQDLNTQVAWSSGGATTPIQGHGRRSASGCTADLDCSSGQSCAPIASYLEVRAVEGTCRAPRGSIAGGMACAQDSDCTSGLCLNPSNHPRVCYAGCSAVRPCGSGACVAGAAGVDLSYAHPGLGAAPVVACLP